MSSGASSVFASVAYQLATNPDLAEDLRQAGRIDQLVEEFPALSIEEREALDTIVRQRFTRQEGGLACYDISRKWSLVDLLADR